MALQERQGNRLPDGSGKNTSASAKRKHIETIDLTGDDNIDLRHVDKKHSNHRFSRDNNNNSRSHASQSQSSQTPQSSSSSSRQFSQPSSSYSRPSQLSSQSSYGSSFSSSSHSGPGSSQHFRPADSLSQQQQRALDRERDQWLAEEEDDVNETLDSTQASQAERNEGLVHYGDLDTKIVGVRFYRGNANQGEQILMRREPGNPYDSNAIRVDNVAGIQIGHIPRQMAAKLAKYMDPKQLMCEGELAGEIQEFDCPLTVHLFGPDPNSSLGRQVMESMRKDRLPVGAIRERERAEKRQEKERQKAEQKRLAEERRAAAAPGNSGRKFDQNNNSLYANQGSFGDGTAEPVMDDILEASQRFSPREVGRSTSRYGMKEDALKNLPSATQPKGIKTEMLPYQLQALKWLLDHEDPQLPQRHTDEAVQLWKKDKRRPELFNNLATNHSTRETPKLANGGILCDDMGLGKTLEMIALIMADNEKAGKRPGTTLIVSPLSVMSNWKGQMASHVHGNKALNVYIYHGSGRVQSMKSADLSQYDVVITTYQTLASDYMSGGQGKAESAPAKQTRSTGLYSMNWRRIILDEGHTVRNPQSKGAAAVTAVTAKSRWVLTGTPIVNSLKDLYCLLRFVGITGGLENLEIFNRVLVRPLKAGDTSATYLLHAVMTAFTLRRRKEMKFIDLRLPKLDEYVHHVEFTKKERERYEALETEAKGLLQTFPQKSGTNTLQAYAHLLEVLLRMRQCCNHWQLCGERITNLMTQLGKQKTVERTPENEKALQDMLQVTIQSQEECAICLDTMHNPVITVCAHAFGEECISRVIETQHKCPMCRAELKDENSLVHSANNAGDDTADDEMDLTQSSSKLEVMMQILNATRSQEKSKKNKSESEGKSKTIIFSQWTRFLDIVQSRLDSDGYTYCRLDGTMSASQRDSALHALEHDPDCTIMLASLGVCAVGLNLTAANQIILSDTWWAPAIEDQAVDRVHRLGQKRETRVFRLVVDHSIEQQTIAIQQDKRKLMRLAFAEKTGKRDQVKAGRLADIEKLLHASAGAASSSSTSTMTTTARTGGKRSNNTRAEDDGEEETEASEGSSKKGKKSTTTTTGRGKKKN